MKKMTSRRAGFNGSALLDLKHLTRLLVDYIEDDSEHILVRRLWHCDWSERTKYLVGCGKHCQYVLIH